MEMFSYGKKGYWPTSNKNQYVKYKDFDLWTCDPIMTNQYVKYEDYVKWVETIIIFKAAVTLTFGLVNPKSRRVMYLVWPISKWNIKTLW
jgi:hypothetical protein